MPFAQLRRIVAGVAMSFAVIVLAIVLEGAFNPIFDIVDAMVPQDSVWYTPLEYVGGVAELTVAILLFVIAIWVLVGPITRSRVEQEERMIRRHP